MGRQEGGISEKSEPVSGKAFSVLEGSIVDADWFLVFKPLTEMVRLS